MIDPKKYGTASEISEATKIPRTTLITAANRGEITHCHSLGGTLLLELASVKAWVKVDRKTGPKPQRLE